jgi:Reverse transcriptase (RNA-dependent DNA polymerase)
MDAIEPASGPWSAPVVLIPKPDGSIRFCVDYRKLNAVTENDSYALPRVDDCLDSLGEARYFTALDANCGYWQIDVNETDREKTAFTCHKGLYQFKGMPFGLMTAPATFQRAIDVVFSSVRFQCALTYLDDVIYTLPPSTNIWYTYRPCCSCSKPQVYHSREPSARSRRCRSSTWDSK